MLAVSLLIALVSLALIGFASQYYCPSMIPLYSQPGLHLTYKIVYTEDNTTYVFYRNLTIVSRENFIYNVSYRILDINGTYTGQPNTIQEMNTSYHIFRDSALEEFPLTGTFIPITAKTFKIGDDTVLAMGYYLPQSGMIIYVSLDHGIPVYATLSYGSTNMTYTLISIEGVDYCHAWLG